MKNMQRINLRLVALAVLAVMAVFTLMGFPLVSPEILASIGIMPMVMGEVDMKQISELIEKQGRTFEEFKKTNDELLKAKANGAAVSDIEAKLAKMNDDLSTLSQLKTAIESMEKKLNRPGAGGEDPTKSEHKSAFGKFLRKGSDDGLADLQRKAYNITTDADGGYAVPEELDRDILSLLTDVSPIREIATVRTIGSSDYKKLVNKKGSSGGWVDEDDARPETSAAQLALITPFMGEVYAYPQATQTMLEDVFFNAEQFITQEGVETFAQLEGAAFVTGDGTKKPKGFAAYATAATADGARAFGTLEHITSGAAADFAGANPQDKLLDVVYALKAGYRANARWVTSKNILRDLRKMKDSEGNYIWRPGLEAGQPDLLLGYGITEAEDMPAKAANALSIAFGDFKRGYLIVDRIGTTVLRDPYSNKPFVGFYMRKRVGGAVVDSNAIKFLKFAA